MQIKELIRKYQEGTLTDNEFLLLQDYLGTDDLSILEDSMKQDWQKNIDPGQELAPGLSQEMLRKIKSEIRKPKIIPIKKSRRYQWVAAASVLLLLLVAGAALWWSSPEKTKLVTAFGKWETVQLPDGSIVELNANSELTYTTNWQKGANRKVWLKGEAFFKVKKEKSEAKFMVVTKDLTVEVLGTSFNVNSHGEETKVYLEEGEVKLYLEEVVTHMKPGEFLAYSGLKKAITERKEAPAELHTSWKDGTLILNDETVANIIKKVEEIFGVTFKTDDPDFLNQKKTIMVPMDEMDVALPLLERLLGVKFEKKTGIEQ